LNRCFQIVKERSVLSGYGALFAGEVHYETGFWLCFSWMSIAVRDGIFGAIRADWREALVFQRCMHFGLGHSFFLSFYQFLARGRSLFHGGIGWWAVNHHNPDVGGTSCVII
jgi:hypothetical protein